MTDFEEIYRTYFKDVFLYLKCICGNEQLAEEITAETFLKAMKSIRGFKGTCDIRVWLCQIAKNTYFSWLRKKKRNGETELPEELAADTDVEETVCTAENSLRIHQILHDLPEPYKEIFSLRVFSELSFRQIGSLFGKSENWACVTFHRAKGKIKEQLDMR